MKLRLLITTSISSLMFIVFLQSCKKQSGHVGQPGSIGKNTGSDVVTNPTINPEPSIDPTIDPEPTNNPTTQPTTDPTTNPTAEPNDPCNVKVDLTLAGGPTETWKQCDDKGLVWVPIVNSDATAATCGPQKVTSFKCCAANIAKMYPSLSPDRNTEFNSILQDNLTKGFQLYHCEQRGSGEVVFHFYHPNFKGPGDSAAKRAHRWICARKVVADTSATQSDCPALDMSRLNL